mgnify:CR=1 FL=1
MNEAHQHKKVLGVRDMVLFSVSAILLLDTLAAGQALAYLEDEEQTIAFERTGATLETRRWEFERTEKLFEQELVSEEIYERARREARDAEHAAEADKRIVEAPASVTFTDMSQNLPSSWAWDFDDDGVVVKTMQMQRQRVGVPVWRASLVIEAEAGAFAARRHGGGRRGARCRRHAPGGRWWNGVRAGARWWWRCGAGRRWRWRCCWRSASSGCSPGAPAAGGRRRRRWSPSWPCPRPPPRNPGPTSS